MKKTNSEGFLGFLYSSYYHCHSLAVLKPSQFKYN